MLVEVAVGAPVRGTFTYQVEDGLILEPGRRLVVPFGRRRAVGFYLGPATVAPEGEVKFVEQILDDGPVFPPDVLALLRFASDYYLYPLGEALRGALPPEMGRVMVREPVERAPAIEAVQLIEPPQVALAALGRSKAQAALIQHLAARGGPVPLEELKLAVKGAPALLRKLEEKALVRLIRAEPGRDRPGDPAFDQKNPHAPTAPQASAIEAITSALGTFSPFLLHGITGSGKTEVYLHAIAQTRARGLGALVLVPEIALTPQLAGRFRSRFGADVAVLHSGLSDRERTFEFRRLLAGEAHIAVGVRSAVFAPVRNLGILIVDEEHESSFKQEEKLRYHARDLAVYRARLVGAPCVLGSATPSLETLKNARDGRYGLLEISERVDSRPLPSVEIVDLSRRGHGGGGQGGGGHGAGGRGHAHGQGSGHGQRQHAHPNEPSADGPELLGPALALALEETLAAGQQTILFLNRRGHASLVLCAGCGESARCGSCDVALTHHLSRNELRCHYCDFRIQKPETCPVCGDEILVLGIGTERLEQEIARRFPAARTLRLDRDAASNSTELTRILATFARGEADVMIGTQMVAKGHDFPGVTLVGVILADVGLGLPDFRAAERTFQLLTQVAGRAGRGKEAGRVVVQTFNPQAEAVAAVVSHDYDRFVTGEIERRREVGYPPFRRMLALRLEGMDLSATERMAGQLGEAARRWSAQGMAVLGPAPAPIARLRGRFRFQLLVMADGPRPLLVLGRKLMEVADKAPSGVRVSFDVDPGSML